jgi:hypothetical protein
MGYLKDFKIVEEKFAEFIKKYGETSSSTRSEDINEHWDVKLDVKFDVKALKKIKRSDLYPDENIHWVELRNVNGDKGWLYGDADYFVFETDDYWLVVEKEKLQKFISEKCKEKIKTEEPALYKFYTRKDRKDVVALVKTIDLIYISEKMFKK